MNYSFLMSVYYKEKPGNLKASIESMLSQTLSADEIVIICDGELTEELNQILNDYKTHNPNLFNIVHLKENQGLGKALQIGVNNCKNDIVARMDSDDISDPQRCEKEIQVLEKNPNLTIVGSWIREFHIAPGDLETVRKVPEENEDILRFCKKRSPFNHPSVMFRKDAVLEVGNYPDIRFTQDYDLWYRLLRNGYKGYNVQESLVNMRVGDNLYKRRSGEEYWKIQTRLFKKMKNDGFISSLEFYRNLFVRRVSTMVPNNVRKFIYTNFLRK